MKVRVSASIIVPVEKEIEIPDADIRTYAEDTGEDASAFEGTSGYTLNQVSSYLRDTDVDGWFEQELDAIPHGSVDPDELYVDAITEPLKPEPKMTDLRSRITKMAEQTAAYNEQQISAFKLVLNMIDGGDR